MVVPAMAARPIVCKNLLRSMNQISEESAYELIDRGQEIQNQK
jgi:hypothetical protein